MLGVPLKSICEMIPPSCPLEKNRAVTSLRCIGACCMCSTTLISSPGLYFCKGCSLTQSSFRTPASTTVSLRAPETLPKPAGAPCPPRRRSYWLRCCLSSLRSISSSHILVSRSRRYLANSWETSRRAIRPCTASSVPCGLAGSISPRACCSAIRWLPSIMHLLSDFLVLTALRFQKSTSCTLRGAAKTTLCLKRQVFSKRRVHSYVPSPADDRLELSSTFFGQDFLGPAQSRVGSRETDGGEGEDDGMQDLRLRNADAEQLAHMRTHGAF